MTLQSATSKVRYVGDGVQTAFPIPFRFLREEHVAVWNSQGLYKAGADYEISGGNVVFKTAPTGAVAILRTVPFVQETDYVPNGDVPAETLEGNLDYLTMQTQQLAEQLTRALLLDPTQDFDQEDMAEQFSTLVNNAERWAKSSADEAYLSKLTAAEAAAKAGKSEAKTGSMHGEVARMYDDSSLNRAHLVFGEWGTLEGMYINYEDWTATETLIGLPAALAAHNADGSAHPGFAKKTEVESARNSAVSEARMPAGCVTAFAGGGTVPAGWFVCDGREVSRGEHPELFAAIGVTYGDGDGSTTFNLPDFRGRFLRGYLGELSGEIGAEQPEGLPDVDLALRMDNPNVRANVKAAPRMDEAVYGSDGYAVTDTTGTDEYMIRQSDLIDREKAGQLVKSAVYGRSEHVTPMNFAVQWIIKN